MLIVPPTEGSDAGGVGAVCISNDWDEDVEDESGVFPVDMMACPAAADVAIKGDEDEFEESDERCLLLISSSQQIGYIDRSGSSSGLPADRIRFPLTFCRVILRLRNFLPRRNFSW